MGSKWMTFVAMLSGAMAVLVGIVAMTTSSGIPSPFVPISLAFTAICALAAAVSGTLRQQAMRIAELERRLSQSDGRTAGV